MIKAYSSKAGGGKSITMLLDVAKERNKKIAFICLEVPVHNTLKKLDSILNYCEIIQSNINVRFFDGSLGGGYDLIKKLDDLKDDYDIICIDGFDSYRLPKEPDLMVSIAPRENLVRSVWSSVFANGYFFKRPSRCKEVWVTVNVYNTFGDIGGSKIAYNGISESAFDKKAVIKKYSRIDRNNLNDETILEVTDFDNRTIENYNLSDILTNKS
jgi:hypothetical protein